MPPPLLKVCVLGSSAVGKTTLIESFALQQRFTSDSTAATSTSTTSATSTSVTTKTRVVHCSSSFNGVIHHFKVIDMPAIAEFPATPLAEWTQFHRIELRTAHAYIFVFDLSLPSTFYYVKVLRDQLFESRNMQNVPVWIVGNKADLCLNVLATVRSHRHHDHHHHHHPHHPHPHHQPNTRHHAHPPSSSHHHHHHHHYHHHHPRPLQHVLHPGSHSASSPYEDLTPAFKELANLVRKQWKCSYIECSAKYDWRVLPIFREIVKSLESTLQSVDQQQQQQQAQTSSMQQQQQQQQSLPSTGTALVSASRDQAIQESSDIGRARARHRSASNDNHSTAERAQRDTACKIV